MTNGTATERLPLAILLNDSMKPSLAWLLSVLLVLVQGVTTSGKDVPQAARKCSRCACGRPCCVSPSTPASTPLPTSQVDLPSAKQFQPALSSAVQKPPPFPSNAEEAPLFILFSSGAGVIPIYDWNCSYLL